MKLKLKEIRLQAGKTQQEVADAVHLTQVGYNGYEKGRRFPNPSMLVKLADYFNVSVDELIGHEIIEIPEIKHLRVEQQEVMKLVSELNSYQCSDVKRYIEGIISQQDNNLE